MRERRKNKRHSLEGKIIIKRLDDANGVREANIDISDVSRTGVGFCCNEILTIGSVYECRLTLWTKEVLNAFLEIVRIEKKQNTFSYGAIFIGMPEGDLQRITVYETVSEHSDK